MAPAAPPTCSFEGARLPSPLGPEVMAPPTCKCHNFNAMARIFCVCVCPVHGEVR